ncbi:hypothetical protein BGZ96_008434 [Linnemannia gamsii]|uniref:Choline/ethanolaminephosphotransferase n=1 Tax=Linnemannia gamsii TaxID=64522 RepID=A0ABQ7KEZ3_9FUNG|nr:hypothetical protein BGZ96_008434 [Linnemannia gamsii]
MFGFGSRIHDSEYVSDAGLANLRLYKYGCVDKSPVTKYILSHYWNWAVTLFPMWMAPNLITLIGFGFVVSNLFVVMYFIPDLYSPGPTWVYFSCAIGLWLYSTFDNVDGKQARRTGTSSPLGELFDHGCDALNCCIGSVNQAACMSMGHSWYSAFLLLLTTLPFFLSTWEEYHTGVLYLGYVNGPTEGLILACVVMLISGFMGPLFWRSNAVELFGTGFGIIPDDWILLDLMVAGMTILMVVGHIPPCLIAVYKSCKEQNKSVIAAYSELLPMSLFLVSAYAWLSSPYSYIFKEQHFILFAVTIGIVFGRMATKIILAHVTKSAFPYFTVQLIPLIFGAFITNAPVLFDWDPIFTADTEYYFLWAYFIFVAVAYAQWAVVVIDRFCTYLGIKCLSIPRPKAQQSEEEEGLIGSAPRNHQD